MLNMNNAHCHCMGVILQKFCVEFCICLLLFCKMLRFGSQNPAYWAAKPCILPANMQHFAKRYATV